MQRWHHFLFFLTEKWLESRNIFILPDPILSQLWKVPHKPYWVLGVVTSTQASCVVSDRVAFPHAESSGGQFSHEDEGGVT